MESPWDCSMSPPIYLGTLGVLKVLKALKPLSPLSPLSPGVQDAQRFLALDPP